ncbi:metallophosphoesterase [Pseudooceanicola sp. 200-1SW]|uniref:metallophosphoesterase n=1 Tax=Pseudooceanicola sp. 200-1SW TaxID=3425949 RepID=UPI003D7FBDC6
MFIAQLSDLHLRDDGADLRHDPAEALARAFDGIARMQPQPALILLTGDVIDRTTAWTPRAYDRAAALLARAPAPLVALSGNHDRPEPFRAALGGRADFAPEHLSFALPLGPLTVIGLDSTRPDGGAGVDAARLDWLAAQLAALEGPALLALHHPPFATGIPRADAAPFAQRDALRDLVTGSRVARVIAGHVHRPVFTQWAGVPASTAPALTHGLSLSLTPGGPHAHVAMAPGLHLHQLTEAGAFLTHPLDLAGDHDPQGIGAPLTPEARAQIVHF